MRRCVGNWGRWIGLSNIDVTLLVERKIHVEIVQAVMPVEPIRNGQTKPFLIRCDDGNQYYVKFKENPESSRVLINEFVCTKIAEIIDIPITPNKFVQIDAHFIQLYGPTIQQHIGEVISAGLHFGSLKVDKAYPITSSKMIANSVNTDCLSTILMFDHLVGNGDRVSNKGNILMNGVSKEITVIDHSHAFELGPIWDEHQLRRLVNQPILPLDLTGYVYSKWVPHINGNSPFSHFFQNLTRLTLQEMSHIIDDVPDEWIITDSEKEALLIYLEYRKDNVHMIPQLLKPSLPHWKGGS